MHHFLLEVNTSSYMLIDVSSSSTDPLAFSQKKNKVKVIMSFLDYFGMCSSVPWADLAGISVWVGGSRG